MFFIFLHPVFGKNEIVKFKSVCFEKEVRLAVNGYFSIYDPPQTYSKSDLLKIRKMTVYDCLEYQEIVHLPNLEHLNIGYSKEFPVIKNLKKLSELRVWDNKNTAIMDLAPIQLLSRLKGLDLVINNAKSIKNINVNPNIEKLEIELGTNFPKDLHKVILMEVNNAKFIKRLKLDGNFSSISFLSDLENLEELDIQGNPIEDYAFLKEFKSLRYLDIRDNPVRNIYFEVLKELPNLKEIQLDQNQSSVLEENNLKHLEKIKIEFDDYDEEWVDKAIFLNNFYSIPKILDVPSLEFSFENAVPSLKEISIFKNLTGLKIVLDDSAWYYEHYYSWKLNDLTPLQDLKNLRELEFQVRNDSRHILKFNSFLPLSKLKKLEKLSLSIIDSINQIQDLQYLSNTLKYLDLSYNEIRDVSPLAHLTNLTHLDLAGNQISDLRPLKDLMKLKKFKIESNSVCNQNYIPKNLEKFPISDQECNY